MRFRPISTEHASSLRAALSEAEVRRLVDEAVQPSHFFVAGGLQLEWCQPVQETIAWEIFRGRLLAPAMTRLWRTFTAWNIFALEEGDRSGVPLLSVLLDSDQSCLHIVRGIRCYAWESSDAGPNVVAGRETRQWQRELVGTIRLCDFTDPESLRDELICLLFHAVVGTSRLPLTSVEAPFPAFSFGQLLYMQTPSPPTPLPRGWGRGEIAAQPTTSPPTLLRHGRGRGETAAEEFLEERLAPNLAFLEKIKLVETWLRQGPIGQLREAVPRFVFHWRRTGHTERDLMPLLIGLFQQVSLTPYTDFVEKALKFASCLEDQKVLQPAQTADFLTFLLRLTARHLTAYDLVTFHHMGANYPDALMLDSVLKEVFVHGARHPDLYFSSSDEVPEEERRRRLRRRGLRQGCLIRTRYEGHPVPDLPTSQGENVRVLPPSHPRVAQEQIVSPLRRGKKLFEGDPLADHLKHGTDELLRVALQDLHHPLELLELGMALFLDRPLGALKAPIESDNTLLFSYEAFSPSIAMRRLQQLTDTSAWIDPANRDRLLEELRRLVVEGVPLSALPVSGRPEPISLDDARKVAADFVFLRTTRPALKRFFEQYDFTELRRRPGMEFLQSTSKLLVIRDAAGLAIYDETGRKRVELAIDAEAGYRSRAGVEYPVEGMRVLRIWEDPAEPQYLDQPIRPIV